MKNRILQLGFSALFVGVFFLSNSYLYAAPPGGNTKSGSALNLSWQFLGPDNVAGRTRVVLFDNRDVSGSTLYAGSVSGGIWRSTNLGLTWHEVNTASPVVIKVSCMAQTSSGAIYAGTGEAFCTERFTGFQDIHYSGAFMGTGLFRSVDGENFTVIPATLPALNNSNSDWAYINALVISQSGRIFAATNNGLKYSDDGDTWANAAVSGFVVDVQVGASGKIYAATTTACYMSDGDVNTFVSISTGAPDKLPSADLGRVKFAIAPSDNNVVYASVTKASDGSMLNIYRSNDGGNTWYIIFPGNNTYDPFRIYYGTTASYQGCYDNTMIVFPDNPDKVLLGGLDLWIGTKYQSTGYFDWSEVSFGNIPSFFDVYVPYSHHWYTFQPGSSTKMAMATDGGVSVATFGSTGVTFQTVNKQYEVSQYYSVDFSTEKRKAIGGVQGNGIQLIDGNGNTPEAARQIWVETGAGNDGLTGGYADWSLVNPNYLYYSIQKGAIRRSEDLGATYALTFENGLINDKNFIMPLYLWESFNFPATHDSIKYIAKDTIHSGQAIWVLSPNGDYPFQYTITSTLPKGDSIMIPDKIQSRFFMAAKRVPNSGILMTTGALNFKKEPEWYRLATLTDTVTCLAVSGDVNYVYAGTRSGKLFRLANVAQAYDSATADVTHDSTCVIVTTMVKDFASGQSITSVSIAPNNNDRVLVTLGNYGKTGYAYITDNATDSLPTFRSIQGNLSTMPIYSSLIEMHNQDRVLLGTEHGVFTTDDVSAVNPTWTADFTGMGTIPVFMLRQQTIFQPFVQAQISGKWYYHPGINNNGVIYAATYGNGIYMDTTYYQIMGVDPIVGNIPQGTDVKVYPNPAKDQLNVVFNMPSQGSAIFSIYDMNGKMLQQYSEQSVIKGTNTAHLPLGNIPAGIYMIRVQTGSTIAHGKFMVVK